jgi:hypothetical protein
MREVGGVPYGAFIVPGLIMLSIFTESINNASFGIYFPKFTGTIYELLSAPVSRWRSCSPTWARRYQVGDPGLIILATAQLLRAGAHRAPGLDGGVPAAHHGDLLPVRLHHSASWRRASSS